ncbi:MAG: PIN domain-containing protein, partial [Gammaproteobacteria bacterium]|nr:PIN domain-containing protein [Gammaproteobacteria bacterium]
MSDEALFLDTNVLVYIFDGDEPDKQAVARQLLRDSGEIRLSTQVLSEFYVTVTRKLARPLAP